MIAKDLINILSEFPDDEVWIQNWEEDCPTYEGAVVDIEKTFTSIFEEGSYTKVIGNKPIFLLSLKEFS